ncbi:putative pollen-specific leucine-rich repeat extensin-like protein 3 [Iris pallida]|uniref:Pollen-specific leucine-rich repeat extensin-like protein 3 n=1 Tax=Iris pallida TaxID=29817 RepID=A0AAX6GF94_IRIPA|nr:putative pollen-specific leucine-rich repeat extensin-like protein 3 [Iris pallida]
MAVQIPTTGSRRTVTVVPPATASRAPTPSPHWRPEAAARVEHSTVRRRYPLSVAIGHQHRVPSGRFCSSSSPSISSRVLREEESSASETSTCVD